MEYEPHIAHAIATFSELGIGTAALLIVDVAKWRTKVQGMAADPIAFNDLCVQARRMNGLYQKFIKTIHEIGKLFDKLLFSAPYISLTLGVYALFGISFHLPIVGAGEVCYFWCSVSSFTLAFIAAIVEKSGAKVADGASATAGEEIPRP